MIKLICIVKRLPELSYEEFLRHWEDNHAKLIKKHAKVLGIKKYTQSSSIDFSEMNYQMVLLRNTTHFDFDGIAELWYSDIESHLSSRKSLDGANALEEIIADEKRFIDLSKSQMWYSSELLII
ncbi:EthD domain-containing protein [Shewanella dokdonensis]|uniref:EthD domain-containing protein n=1 Tax=Shewanella dokdonensis TaxID=712036 RepID=A0ABX8DGH8_9GAMM|nr:EthD domain-containing protein [Shewanella dokdonensis]MCL1074084.1 EthD domain-containing protein [Shewanella dokdonensis]QVK23823.1 EthD domain-containing protein [Shewanella dokdonensis]